MSGGRRARAELDSFALIRHCKARFARRFGFAWRAEFANRILDDDALTISAILSRASNRKQERARQVLNELRSRALAARKVAGEVPDDGIGALLRSIVKRLPKELLAANAEWARPKKLRARSRVRQRAAEVLGVEALEPIDLAVIGIIAGVHVRIQAGDEIADVLRREARSHSSARTRARYRRR